MSEDRVALITGGAGAIGSCVATSLARIGVRVIAADLDEAVADVPVGPGADAQPIAVMAVDVTDEISVDRLFGRIDREYARLDMLVNCAGISPRVKGRSPAVEETSLELWQQALAVNLTGTFLTCRAAVSRMRIRRWGRIVNLASMAGRTVGRATSCYYAASKSGILGFSRVLASEVGRHGITVNCVAPSRIKSPMTRTLEDSSEIDRQYIERTPLGRIGEPQDVAGAVCYLLSDEASFVTGTILDVAGGFYMA
jgi:NAD(P)-dependent dehydrogenase (short-subunit alcohol dehydrogenase family)